MSTKEKAVLTRAKRTLAQVLGGVVVTLPTMTDIDLIAFGKVILATTVIALIMGACSDLPEVEDETA